LMVLRSITRPFSTNSPIALDIKAGLIVLASRKPSDEIYSKEELIAEMGAAMLSGVVGIENKTIKNSASYIQSWLDQLKNDKKLVVHAAAAAQKAADFILGKSARSDEAD
jgi:antirestriction protein ArdC